MATQSFDSADSVLARLARQQPDVIISDIRMPGLSGLDMLSQIREQYPRLPVIIMTAHSDGQRGGFLPWRRLRVPARRSTSTTPCRWSSAPTSTPGTAEPAAAGQPSSHTGDHRRGTGDAGVFRAIGRLSHSNIVLINGESGTGKGWWPMRCTATAHARHRRSSR